MIRTCYLSILLAIIFILISLPGCYGITDSILSKSNIRTTFDNAPGVPTVTGSVVHGFLYAVIAYIVLFLKDKTPIQEPPKIKIEKPDTEEIN